VSTACGCFGPSLPERERLAEGATARPEEPGPVGTSVEAAEHIRPGEKATSLEEAEAGTAAGTAVAVGSSRVAGQIPVGETERRWATY